AAVADHSGVIGAPGGVLIEVGGEGGGNVRLIASGSAGAVERHEGAAGAERIDLAGHVILPGLVNAHAHLDLTHVGPRPHDPAEGFGPWIEMVRRERPTEEEAIRAAVEQGAALSLAGGTVAIGDIAGAVHGRPCGAASSALRATGLSGLSATEFFGLGAGVERAAPLLREVLNAAAREGQSSAVYQTVSPHAPYSVGPAGYALAGELSPVFPIVTHLAESIEERELVTRGRGPLRELLETLGLWTADVAAGFGRGASPVEHVAPHLPAASTAVHVNDASDGDLALLRACGARVVYCPRASAYFGAERHFGPHRYRDMLSAGIPVALGTDSIIYLPAACAYPSMGISVLDEMRLLARRDGVDPLTLLTMATVNGGLTLGISPEAFSLRVSDRPRVVAGVIAVDVGEDGGDPLMALLVGEARPRVIAMGAPPVRAAGFTGA
ncbi:MAG: amidohydrolase family protein, partial [Phycisphaerales bacterium]